MAHIVEASMSAFEIIIGLTAVTVLTSYLFWRHCLRARRQSNRYASSGWTGKPVDLARLKPILEELRQDHRAARRHTRGILFHRRLLELARRTVTRLEYFQDRESHEHAHEHTR
jgi:hypothetical protein